MSEEALVCRLAALAAEHPDRPAVESGESVLGFAELEHDTAVLAGRLRAAGVRAGDLVGVCLPRGVDLLVALIGVWRAGAAYVPLDPAYPARRNAFTLHDSGATALVTSPGSAPQAPGPIVVDITREPADPTVPVRDVPVGADQLAYVIHTSGSTGVPKGVAITHAMVASLHAGLTAADAFRAAPGRVGWNASVCFDASVQQWTRVLRGDTVVVLGDEERLDPLALCDAITDRGLTDLDLTPSHLAILLDVLPETLSERPAARRLWIFLGGEAVPPAMWERLRDWHDRGIATTVTVYGPTECAVDVTMTFAHRHERPSLGSPLAAVRAYVLDDRQRPVPDGGIGELVIGGPQVGLGYVGRPALTAQRFLADVFAGDGSRMYRTGDRVRWAAGALEYHGRTDSQVKVRGCRVELGEVEAALTAVAGVTAAIAGVSADGQVLTAAFTSGSGVTADAVRRALAARLPAHLVPTTLRRVEAIPLTPGGKADRGALDGRTAAVR